MWRSSAQYPTREVNNTHHNAHGRHAAVFDRSIHSGNLSSNFRANQRAPTGLLRWSRRKGAKGPRQFVANSSLLLLRFSTQVSSP
ncbi:hypothetical protein TNCV_5119471 [Trichonephila clavipes]|nr:hypothetical protein TNCV_5119471 [Trichonephila clavipes]